MKKHFIILITAYISFITLDISALAIPANSPKAKEAFHSLQKLPDYHRLVQEVEREGAIKIEMVSLNNESFDAFWDSTDRVIRINKLKNENFNVLICSILFELHNAKSDRRFMHFYNMAIRGEISKEEYVENVERMEHANALKCSLLLEKGISLGIFSSEVRWPIYRNFDDYYKVQQIHEHSHWLAKSYDEMAFRNKKSVYVGTLPKLSAKEKQDVLRYLRIKNELESKDNSKKVNAAANLQKEYNKCEEHRDGRKLLELIFQNNPTYQKLIKSQS